jgi:hypothetical protein
MCIRFWKNIFRFFARLVNDYTGPFKKTTKPQSQVVFIVLSVLSSICIALIPLSIVQLIQRNFDPQNYPRLIVIIVFLLVFMFFLVYMLVLGLIQKYRMYIVLPVGVVTWLIGFKYALTMFGYVRSLNVIFAILLLILVLYHIYAVVRYWRPPNWWLLSTISCILLFVVVGSIFIDESFGELRLKMTLHDCNKPYSSLGSIDCRSIDNKVIVGYNVSCVVELNNKMNYTNLSGYTYFTFMNGTQEKQIYPGSLIIRKQVLSTRFELSMVDQNNQSYCLQNSLRARYPTYQEYTENRSKFLAYLLGLFAFCFITVPIVIRNVQKICRGNK